VARSIREGTRILNVDVGGGTAKLALIDAGRIVGLTALDVGARLVALDAEGRVVRIEDSGQLFAQELGLALAPGERLGDAAARDLAAAMADRLFEAIGGGAPSIGGRPLLRLDPLRAAGSIQEISFSGGVAEYIYGRETRRYGDLGPFLARAIRERLDGLGARLVQPAEGIRATVIGAAQYTIQVSGSTIYVAPLATLPLRNLPVVAPDAALDGEVLDAQKIAAAVRAVLRRLDLMAGESAVALFAPWRGSATFDRLDAFCRGVVEGLAPVLAQGHPLVLAGDGDVGGLIGIHCREELELANAIVSIDGLELKEFDYIDIGAMIDASGAVPVVIKSLVFPTAVEK
jgi:ethanolamine utilization protein EutA